MSGECLGVFLVVYGVCWVVLRGALDTFSDLGSSPSTSVSRGLDFRDPRRRDGIFWPLDLAPVTEISAGPRLGLAPD